MSSSLTLHDFPGRALLVFVMLCMMSVPALAQDSGEEGAEASGGDEATTSTEGNAGVGSLRRSNRMEFDARLIRGETAGSGAVFLFQRAPSALPSMVPLRKSYLQQSVDNVLTPGWTPPKKKSTTSASSEDILESTVVNQGSGRATSTTTTSSATRKKASSKKTSSKRKKRKGKKGK